MASKRITASRDDVAEWEALLAEALARTGGAMTAEERVWADEILGTKQYGEPSREG